MLNRSYSLRLRDDELSQKAEDDFCQDPDTGLLCGRLPGGGSAGGGGSESGKPSGSAEKPTAAKPTSEKPSRSSLSDKEKNAIKNYQGDGFEKMNASLRNGNPPGEKVKELDAIINKFRLSQDFTVYRGVGNTVSKQIEDNWKEGVIEFSDKAFVSTSMSKKIAERFSKNTMEISLPKGHPVLDIVTENFEHSPEQEILLPRNVKFKVTSVRRTAAGWRHIKAVVALT